MKRGLRWLVALSSLAIGATLAVLPLTEQHGGFAISRAKRGNYYDLRFDASRWAFTLFSQWPMDQSLHWERLSPPLTQRDFIIRRFSIPLREGIDAELTSAVMAGKIVQNRSGTAFIRISKASTTQPANLLHAFIAASTRPTARVPAQVARSTPTTKPATTSSTVAASAPAQPWPGSGSTGSFNYALGSTPILPGGSFDSRSSSHDHRYSLGADGATHFDFPRPNDLTLAASGPIRPTLSTAAPLPIRFSLAPAYPVAPYAQYILAAWLPATIAFVPAFAFGLVGLTAAWRRRSRRRSGLCSACGYDLRGNAASTNCPECGQTIQHVIG